MGNIIVKRVEDTTNVEATHLNVGTSNLALAIAQRDENGKLALLDKYEKVLKAYNKEVQKIIELENKVMGHSSRPRITYPHPPMEPFKSTPLIKILDTTQRPQYYIAENFEEEKRKLWALHVELNVQYKDKLRKVSHVFG